jgi:hypothetical protein
MAAGVTHSSRAAADSDPLRTTASSTRSPVIEGAWRKRYSFYLR